MRREDISLAVSNVGWLNAEEAPRQPTLSVRLAEGSETLVERLQTKGGEPLDADETDVTFRLHDEAEHDDARGVVAVTNRITGEYVLECNAAASEVLEFVRAARRYGEETGETALYRIELSAGEETIAVYEKRVLLVYGQAGELLREHSLIPSGVEI